MMATNETYHLELAILREKHVAGYFNEAEYLNQCEELQNAEFAAMNQVLTSICSWCSRVIREGNPALPLSHDICSSCAEQYFPETRLSEGEKR